MDSFPTVLQIVQFTYRLIPYLAMVVALATIIGLTSLSGWTGRCMTGALVAIVALQVGAGIWIVTHSEASAASPVALARHSDLTANNEPASFSLPGLVVQLQFRVINRLVGALPKQKPVILRIGDPTTADTSDFSAVGRVGDRMMASIVWSPFVKVTGDARIDGREAFGRSRDPRNPYRRHGPLEGHRRNGPSVAADRRPPHQLAQRTRHCGDGANRLATSAPRRGATTTRARRQRERSRAGRRVGLTRTGVTPGTTTQGSCHEAGFWYRFGPRCACVAVGGRGGTWGPVPSTHLLTSTGFTVTVPAVNAGVTCADSTLHVDVGIPQIATITGASFTGCTGALNAGGCTATTTGNGFPWRMTGVSTMDIQIHTVNIVFQFEIKPGGAAGSCTAPFNGQSVTLTGTLGNNVGDQTTWFSPNHQLIFNSATGLTAHIPAVGARPAAVGGSFVDRTQTLTLSD